MRLPDSYIEAIKSSARDAFGETVVVRLFGSRVHDNLKGGDIDLHVEVDAIEDEPRARSRFEDTLFERIEPQKVDVIISVRGREPAGFERIAYRDGILL